MSEFRRKNEAKEEIKIIKKITNIILTNFERTDLMIEKSKLY
jgi:hypothetical protein